VATQLGYLASSERERMTNELKALLAGLASFLILLAVGVGFAFHPQACRRLFMSEKWNRVFFGLGHSRIAKWYMESSLYILGLRIMGGLSVLAAAIVFYGLVQVIKDLL